MILFTFSQKKTNTIISPGDLRNFADALFIVLSKKGFLQGSTKQCRIIYDTEYRFTLKYEGISYDDAESHRFIISKMDYYLQKVTDLLYISHTSFQSEPGQACDSIIKRTKSRNSQLVENIVKDADIPQRLTCLLTSQLMDSPVYLKGSPEAVYDEVAITYWLYQSEEPKNPTTNLPVNIREDIVRMPELKQEIALWVKEQLQAGLMAKNQRFFSTLNRYKIGEYGPRDTEKALRKAAFSNNLEDFNLIAGFVLNINRQDENPASLKTAFHLAVSRNSIDVIKRLIELRADPFIKDAQQKTCLDYAFESKNDTVKTLVVDFVQRLSAANRNTY